MSIILRTFKLNNQKICTISLDGSTVYTTYVRKKKKREYKRRCINPPQAFEYYRQQIASITKRGYIESFDNPEAYAAAAYYPKVIRDDEQTIQKKATTRNRRVTL